MIRFSVVCTVFNEEKTIVSLLESLFSQKRSPDEIIIVDAGSTDETPILIKALIKQSPVSVRLIVRGGVNRSVGRNIGIREAKNDHVAVIDAGCRADPHWLSELEKAFGKGVMSVGGYYVPVFQSHFEELVAAYTCTLPHHFNRNTFLPSSRSLAFSKEAWRLAGTYPEELETCEDLVYAKRLKDLGTMVVAEKAIVYWQQAESIIPYFRQIFGYAKGDVLADYRPHVIRIISVWLRYGLFVWMPLLLLPYAAWIYGKHRRYVKSVKHWILLPFVQGITDAAVIAGSTTGFFRKLFN